MMDTQQLPLKKLKPYPGNAKTHPQVQIDKIARSIDEFGFDQPIVVDSDTVIIKGHGRYLAAKQLQLKRVPVIIRTDLTPAQVKAARIMDNKSAESDWDLDMLVKDLESLNDLGGFDMNLTGFDPDELLSLLGEPESGGGKTSEDYVPPEPTEPVSRSGDLWICGKHRVMCGDATNKDHVKWLCNGEEIDLVWTDPPYNVDYTGGPLGNRDPIENDAMDLEQYYKFLKMAWGAMFTVMKPGACFYIAHPDMISQLIRQSILEFNYHIAQCLIWVKNTATLSRQDYNWQHEPILYGWKKGGGHYFSEDYTLTTVIDAAEKSELSKLKKAQLLDALEKIIESSTVIRIDRPTRSELHPTMKPVELVKRCVVNSSRGGQIVLDPFGGSGTTLLTCEQTLRRARIMELKPNYCDVIVNRWQLYTGHKAHLEGEDTREIA